MSLTFPRKFTHGVKTENADAYAELFVWPEGHFQLMVHIRCTDARHAAQINATVVLLDQTGQPIGTFGMAQEEMWTVGPPAYCQSSQRHDQLFGKIPEEKLQKTEAVTLVLRAPGQEIGADELRAIANRGAELVLCPVPD